MTEKQMDVKSGKPAYKRVLLKLSGEALQGKKGFGIDPDEITCIARQIVEVRELGVQVAVVIGGGNILRGRDAAGAGIDPSTADYMGMLATVINALALQDCLEKNGMQTRTQTAIEMQELAEPYIRRRAIRHLEKGRVVVFAGGTGNPYFTTDTAAALRGIEIDADVLLKATKVEGVYSADPKKDANAKKYEKLSYLEVLEKRLGVMDATAISLCMDNNLPVIVFNMNVQGNIKRAVLGEKIGTRVSG